MDCIIRGIQTKLEKERCLDGVNENITKDLAAGVPDIRKVIESLDKLGAYLMDNKGFLIPELMELGFSKEEAVRIKEESVPVLSAGELFKIGRASCRERV